MNKSTFSPLAVCGVLFSLLFCTQSAAAGLDRFALIFSNNHGGENREILRYAGHDAQRMENVLTTMGGIRKENLLRLDEASESDLNAAFNQLATLLNKSHATRKEVILYYSGHADREGVLLEGRRYEYRILRKKLAALPAKVKIAVLDACESGSFIRDKGGRITKPFLIDESSNMEGYAILTSSSRNEVSQESDKIGGSYFSNSLVTGLRGAADTDKNGRVTLNEAYRYASDETLKRTTRAQAGTQHPNYEMNLTGQGEVVMTDLAQVTSTLNIDANLEGRFFIRDSQSHLIAELTKDKGHAIQIGVEPGKYTVEREFRELQVASVQVVPHQKTLLADDAFRSVNRFASVSRGNQDTTKRYHLESCSSIYIGNFITGNDEQSVCGMLLIPGYGLSADLVGLSIGGFAAKSHRVRGLQLGGFASQAYSFEGLQVGGLYTSIDQELQGLQVAGIFTRSGSMQGLSVAGIIGLSGDLKGLQVQGIYGRTHKSQGLQVSGVVSQSHDFQGLQVSGLGNQSQNFQGLQVAGLGNQSQNFQGLQVAGLGNQSKDFQGLQVAGIGNLSHHFEGLQVAGIFNRSQTFTGLQVSLYNQTDTLKGMQIGLINQANSSHGFSLGLINLVKDGIFTGALSLDFTKMPKISLRSGHRYGYTIISYLNESYGRILKDHEKNQMGFGVGFGTTLPLPMPYTINLEYEQAQIWDELDDWDDNHGLHSVYTPRVRLGYQVHEYAKISIGLDINFMVNDNKEQKPIIDPPMVWADWEAGSKEVSLWPGLNVNLEMGLF